MENRSSTGQSRAGVDGWSSTLEIRQLRAFLAIVEHGSVTSAAAALGCAQSTLSETLAALDRAVGAATVARRRGAHAISLTLAGESLLPHARQILQALEAAHRGVAAVNRATAPSIEITTNESVSTYLLAPVLVQLRKHWTNTRFVVSVATCGNTRADVAAGRCDLGVLLQSPSGDSSALSLDPHGTIQPSTRSIDLHAEVPLLVVAAQRHRLIRDKRRGAVPRYELSEYPVFVTDGAGDYYDLIRKYLTADAMPNPSLRAVGSIDAVKRAVIADERALGILPYYAVADDIREKRVAVIAVSPSPPTVRLVALVPPDQDTQHPAVVDLLSRLRSLNVVCTD
ncbi:MAG: LysR family transcriptional regulator [Gemmatimonadaceae bacterium]